MQARTHNTNTPNETVSAPFLVRRHQHLPSGDRATRFGADSLSRKPPGQFGARPGIAGAQQNPDEGPIETAAAPAPHVTFGFINASPSVPNIKRIIPGKTIPVQAKLVNPSGAVRVVVSGARSGNGSATFGGASEHPLNPGPNVLPVTGGTQTARGQANRLSLVAYMDTGRGGEIAIGESHKFSVAAWPAQMEAKLVGPMHRERVIGKRGLWYGAKYRMNAKSDSDDDTHLDEISTAESVKTKKATGWWKGFKSKPSRFRSTTLLNIDHHATGGLDTVQLTEKELRAHGRIGGKYVVHQYFVFNDKRTGMRLHTKREHNPTIPNSGFIIARTLSPPSTGGTHTLTVQKVGMNHGTGAGVSHEPGPETVTMP